MGFMKLTSCSKNTILVWIPCLFLWLFSPMEIYLMGKSRKKGIPATLTNVLKMILIVLIAVLNLKSVICYLLHKNKYIISIYKSLLMFFTFVLYFILTWGNLQRGIKYSRTSLRFSFLSIVCGLPIMYEICWSPQYEGIHNAVDDPVSECICFFSIILIFFLNYFTNSKPKYSQCAADDKMCPLKNASLISNLTVSWFNKFIWRYRNKSLEENLWELDEEDRTNFLINKSQRILNDVFRKSGIENDFNEKDKSYVLKLLWRLYGNHFIWIIMWRIVDTIFIISYPLVFGLIIAWIKSNKPLWMLNTCAFGFLFTSLCDAIVLVIVFMSTGKLQIRVRSTLMSVIYGKMLRITDRARCQYTAGEIVTLMTTNVGNITDSLQYIPYLLQIPLHITVSFYYIWTIYGIGTFICIVVLVMLLPFFFNLTKSIMKLSHVETENKDKRAKFINDLLAGIKVLKMYAWESSFIKRATLLRKEEFENLKQIGFRFASLLFFLDIIPPLMSSLSFATYMYSSHTILDVGLLFVTVSVFNTFKTPLRLLSNYFTHVIQAYMSIKRIDAFLNLQELDDRIVSHDKTDGALIIENGNFSWTGADDLFLRDINIKIKKAKLVSVVGHVGAGKSSLISSFLGELYKVSGYVNLNGTTAYVPQQAWIRNASFKDNITFGRKVNMGLYKNSLNFCALNEDLKTFPAGDLTEIGEKGINLSGGQKQRVNIARAICCNADIYFFDDALSAVDSYVSRHIFEKVMGPNGLLKDKTRVLVSHNVSFLRQSDCIIFMENGRIKETGTFEELINKPGTFSEFLLHYSEDGKNLKNKWIENEKISKIDNISESTVNSKLIEKEHLQIGSIKKNVYIFILYQFGLVMAFLVLLFIILSQIFSVCARMWLNLSSSNDFISSNEQIIFILIYSGLGMLEASSSYAANLIMYYGICKVSTLIYRKLVSSVLQWPLWLLDNTPVDRIVSRATVDIQIIDKRMTRKLIGLIELGSRFLMIILITCSIIPPSIMVFAPIFTVVFIMERWYSCLAHQLQQINSNNRSPFSSFVIETISGLHSIRANNYREKFNSWVNEKIDLFSSASFACIVNMRWLVMRVQILCGVIVTAIAFFTVNRKDDISLGLLCFVMSYAIQWNAEFAWFLTYFDEVSTALIAVERIKDFIDKPKEGSFIGKNGVSNDWPSHGNIQFENYQLRYREENELVLKGISFSVHSGEKVGIVGRTGAGKSSLILALLSVVEPAGGRILIDGVDIARVDLRVLRSRFTLIPQKEWKKIADCVNECKKILSKICYKLGNLQSKTHAALHSRLKLLVLQDPVLFLGTLRFNLDPYEHYSDDLLWNALEKSHLKDFALQLNGKLDYIVEEGGRNLSYGQRQLLCLARALLRKSKILLLDEATASVDLETDEHIQNTIRKQFRECTVFTIAHRLNTLQDYDRILVLKEGNIVEFGGPKSSTLRDIDDFSLI